MRIRNSSARNGAPYTPFLPLLLLVLILIPVWLNLRTALTLHSPKEEGKKYDAPAITTITHRQGRQQQQEMQQQQQQLPRLVPTTRRGGGGGQQRRRLCTRSEIKVGTWTSLTRPKPLYVPVKWKRCEKRDNITSPNHPHTTWTWTPTAASVTAASVTAATAATVTRNSTSTGTMGDSVPSDPVTTNLDHNNNDDTGSGCDFLDFDPETFCRVLNRRQYKSVAFIGDSLMTEMYHSILHQFGSFESKYVVNSHISAKSTTNGTYGIDDDIVVQVPICNQTATILYPGSADPIFENYKENGFSLQRFLTHMKPDVLIMNRGAHIVSDDELAVALPGFLAVLQSYYQHQQDQQDTTVVLPRFLWKTTTVGHPNCWEYTQPVPNKQQMIELVNNRSLYHPYPWREWWTFDQQNKMVLKAFSLVSSSSLPSSFTNNNNDNNNADTTNVGFTVEIMDGWDMLLPRPDLHRAIMYTGRTKRVDCLHHCHPGPFDVFAQIISQYLHLSPEEVMS